MVAFAAGTERAMIFKFASIQGFCAPAVRQKNPAYSRSHATGGLRQPTAAGTAKVLDRQLAPRPHSHWHVNPATGRIECRWCVEDDLPRDTGWQQLGLIHAVYQMNRAGILRATAETTPVIYESISTRYLRLAWLSSRALALPTLAVYTAATPSSALRRAWASLGPN